MGFDYIDPGISAEEVEAAIAGKGSGEKKVRELTPEGTYTMAVANIKGRAYGDGKVKAEIFFKHVDEDKRGLKGATLDLFRLNADPRKSTSQKALFELAKAAGVSTDKLAAVNWGVDTSVDTDQFGNLPAALMTGPTVEDILDISNLAVKAIVGIEEFTRKDGTAGAKNVIKAVYALD